MNSQRGRSMTRRFTAMAALATTALLALGVGAFVSNGFAGAATPQSTPAAIANNSGSVYATDVPGCFNGAEGGPYGDIKVTFNNVPPGEYDSTWTITGPPSAGGITTLPGVQFNSTTIWILSNQPVGTYSLSATWTNGNLPVTNPTVTVPNCATGSSSPPPPSPPTNATSPIVGMAATPSGQGYWLVTANGQVMAHGDAQFYGDLTGTTLNQPIVGMAPSYDASGNVNGYWLDASDGGIFAYGGAQFYGSMGSHPLNQPMVSMAVTPDGHGYWTVAADGGIFSFGDAQFYGSMGGSPLNKPVVGMAVDSATGGYWLVASDGGIFSFNAPFHGSTGNLTLNKPIEEMEAAPTGNGYRFVASDGGVFCFNLPFEGSLGTNPPADPIAGMAASGANGYWVVEQKGTVHSFGGAPVVG
jgi:hypothetical protein